MREKTFYIIVGLIVCFSGLSSYAEEPAESWYNEGIAAESSMKYETAVQAYSEAIKLNPSFAQAYLKRGTLIFKLAPSRSVEAIRDLSKAVDLDPDNGDAYYERALLSFFILNNESARVDMVKAAGLGHEGARAFLDPPPGRTQSGYVNLGSHIRPEQAPVVFFDFGKADLLESSRTLLRAIARTLHNELPAVRVYIIGHTDNRGTEAYNDSLALERALAVRSYLSLEGGIASERLVIRSFGKSRPVASNETDEGRATNRRVELIGLKR